MRKDNRRSLFGKYFNLVLIIQNLLLKWFDEWQNQETRSQNKKKKPKHEAQQMEGWLTERGCRGSGQVGLGHAGTGISSYHNLTMADDNLPAKFHLYPFSRFAGIHVSVQFGEKTQGGSL